MKKLLFFTLISTSVWAQDHIRISVLPPVIPLDWSTPRTLFKTAFKNRWEDGGRPFGHVYVELTCGGKTTMTSTRSKNFNPISEFIFEGRGLGILYHTYPGELEVGGRLERELADQKKGSKLLFMDYAITEAHCKRMTKYFDEFKNLNVARGYGLPHRPLFAEGGTDAAFAVSFLEVAGILGAREKEDWIRGVNIPLEYAGPPVKDDTVNFIKAFFFGTEWATGQEKHKLLAFYDPQKMYNWILAEMQAKRHVCVEATSKGVCVDVTMLPVHHGEIWLQHTDPMYRKK